MKNVNLTSLYLNLLAKFNISTFNCSSIKKTGETEPNDIMIRCHIIDEAPINIDEVKTILDSNITGEVKQATATLVDDKIQIYIEFLGNDNSHWDKLS